MCNNRLYRILYIHEKGVAGIFAILAYLKDKESLKLKVVKTRIVISIIGSFYTNLCINNN